MKKNKIVTMTEIAVFASIGFVLDVLASFYSGFFVNGGSISFALLAVVILSFRRGAGAGVCCGLVIGLLDLTDGFYTIADTWYNGFFQISLDYILTYMLVGLVGLIKPLIKNNFVLVISLATLVGGLLKYLCHFISGVLFWPEFPNQPIGERVIFSLVYNGSYMIPTIIVCVVVSVLISIKFKDLFNVKD